ncbi:MAG: hypothetical protein KGZ43_09350 [Sulfuritalea sp.]|nr:hypothetical protein [Sulfuritalea sp.]
MNKQPIEQAKDADLRLSIAALRRAALKAHELAKNTVNSSTVIRRGGKLEYAIPEETMSAPLICREISKEQLIHEDAEWGLKGND